MLLFEIFAEKYSCISLSLKIHFLQSSLSVRDDRVSQQFIARFTMLVTKSFLKNGVDFSQELISGWVDGLCGPNYACDYSLPSNTGNTAENACEIQW